MTSRSATVLVIFIIAILAFCFASVFAAMTGPISILPQESDSGGILDNLSAITDDIDNDNSYGYQQYDDYSSNDYSDDSSDDSSNLETTTDDSQDHADVEKQKTSNDNMKKLIAQQIEDVYMNPIANDRTIAGKKSFIIIGTTSSI